MVVILILASFNSVVAIQTTDDSTFNKYVDKFVNRLKEDSRFKDVDVNEMASAFKNLNDNNNGDDTSHLGFFIPLVTKWANKTDNPFELILLLIFLLVIMAVAFVAFFFHI